MRLRQGFSGAWIAVLAAAADRLTKALILGGLAPGEVRTLLPGILNLRRMSNQGMAFSMLSGHGAALAALTALLIAAVAAWLIAWPGHSRPVRVGLWLILGGGLGNLWDRLFYGGVIDFIEPTFVRFAVFNAADACICVGAALCALGLLLEERKEASHGS